MADLFLDLHLQIKMIDSSSPDQSVALNRTKLISLRFLLAKLA